MGNESQPVADERIELYAEAVRWMQQGDFSFQIPADASDPVGQLGIELDRLSQILEARYHELQKLDEITLHINHGLLLNEVMDSIFINFKTLIPYNRIGLSLIEADSNTVRAHWARSDNPEMRITKGYSAQLEGSSLQTILETGQPRIINDLVEYLKQKPESESTRRIVEEGVRSSLTCPLLANGVAVGFLFFSSYETNTYAPGHIHLFNRIAKQVSVIVEKGRLVSELALKKAAIEHKNAELIRLNELKNTFLGMVAHDLRSPVSILRMSLGLLLSPDTNLTPCELDEILRDMNRQAEHMSGLIDDLLDVTVIESGKLDLRLQVVDLPEFLQSSVRRHNQLASPKGTTIELSLEQPGHVLVDAHRLRQVIDNLVSNAVKFSPPYSLVRVTAERQPAAWYIAVIDQGPGLTDEDQQRLFTAYTRLSAKPTGGERSVGLGLMITRRIVEAHGGEIGVKTAPGKGATFWFTLPDPQ